MAKYIAVANEGIWVINSTGMVTFKPEPTFFGNPTPIKYTMRSSTGVLSNAATIRVEYKK